VVDPRGAAAMKMVVRAPRSTRDVRGVVGLMDISKGGGRVVLNRLERRLRKDCPQITRIRRYTKATFSRPCGNDLRRKIVSECNYVISALAD